MAPKKDAKAAVPAKKAEPAKKVEPAKVAAPAAPEPEPIVPAGPPAVDLAAVKVTVLV